MQHGVMLYNRCIWSATHARLMLQGWGRGKQGGAPEPGAPPDAQGSGGVGHAVTALSCSDHPVMQ